jgi:hypothetical protein
VKTDMTLNLTLTVTYINDFKYASLPLASTGPNDPCTGMTTI